MVLPSNKSCDDVSSLDELIVELHKAFESDIVDVDHVIQLMKSYKSNPAEWMKYAKFDRYRYKYLFINSCVCRVSLFTRLSKWREIVL